MAASLFRKVAPLSVLLITGVAAGADRDRFGDMLPSHAIARIGTNRLRHGDIVTSITFAPDGKSFATTSADHTVSIWETETGRELVRCAGFKREPLAAVFDAKEAILACATADGIGRVFSTGSAGGKELSNFSLKSDRIAAAAFTSDGKLLAVGDEDGRVRLWDMTQRKEVLDFSQDGSIRCLAFSVDQKMLAGSSGIYGIQTWEARTGKKLLSFGKSAYRVLAFSPDGQLLAAGDFDNRIQLFRWQDGTLVGTLTGHKDVWPMTKNGISCLAFAPRTGDPLISGAGDGTVRVWSPQGNRWQKIRRFEAHTDRVTAVAVSPDGSRIVSAAADNTIRVWDVKTQKEVPPASAPQAPLAGMALSSDGKFVVTLDAPLGRLALWDARTGKPADLPGPVAMAGAAVFTPDSTTLAVGVHGQHFEFWNLQTGKSRDDWSIKELDDDQVAIHPIPGMVFDATGKRLALSNSQGLYLSVWEPASGKRLALFTASGGRRAGCLSLSPDGTLLASVGTEALVRLWDVEAAKERGTLLGHSGGTLAVAFSPNGRLIATGGKDHMIRVWEVASGQPRQVFGGQPGWVRTVAFAPDGSVLATANTDGVVRLWDLTAGKLLHELIGHRGAVTRLAFSARGEVLASASTDTTVLVWDTATLLKERKAATITLSPKELEKAWEQLASTDVAAASAALQTLARAPVQTVPLLQQHVKPLKAERLAQWLKDLDNDQFEVREAAAKELAAAGKFAEPALTATLKGNPSAEVRRRVEDLLERLHGQGLSPEELRMLRSLEVLELIGNDAAKQLLTHVAEGAKESEVTRQARAALNRLTKRSP